MPMSLIYLGIMLLVVCVWFILLKRPVYEAVLISFIVLLFVTGKWQNVGAYIDSALSTSLLYSMTAFVAMSIILTKTKIIDGAVAIIIALLGRITGGAGYAAVIASSFMGALSGSGPGNVMATGSITVPAMKRSGFPPELAANVVSNASYLGNMIPPSTNIVAAFGALVALYPQMDISNSDFWKVLWGLSLWFILQKLIMVFVFCKYYKVKPMPKEDIPKFGEVIKTGWQGLLLPLIVVMPFVFDHFFKDDAVTKKQGFISERLGTSGASFFSKTGLLVFIAGIVVVYICCVVKDKNTVTLHKIAEMFSKSVKTIAPAVGVCLFGYMMGALFNDLGVDVEMKQVFVSMNLGKFGTVVMICLITCFLGMVIPGSSLVTTFGSVFIASMAAVGVNPVLAAAMLPCICGVMCGITPPLALGMYAGMSIAQSDFTKTVKNDLWWVAAHFVLEVVVLMGFIPIPGL